MEQQIGSKLGKEYVKAVFCHPAYLTYMQSTSCEMLDCVKHKLESRFQGEISIISDMQITLCLWQKRKLKNRLMKVKEESEKIGLKLNIQKTKIMESGPISSVQSLSHVQLFETSWTAVHHASLSITNSRSLLKLMSTELVMPSNHLILGHPLLLPSILPSIRVFSSESFFGIRWPNYWSLSNSLSNEYSGLISFRMD